eukprot:CAMPEP_0194298066 /NCGR_PEP_ID=MMETSP0169-20130528/59961_1 /TAXON_ID=218684 /ORGANISM="Corethron pennatum, Strain L29A3" /LENGTH=767 /DNA_ID=CAMNT_0039048011 /DNA_START=146 /DNA_END=2449 /DNA_ORIENTATION=+
MYGPLHDLGSLPFPDDPPPPPAADDKWTFPSGVPASLPVVGRDSDLAGPRRAFSDHVNGLGAPLDGSMEPTGPRPHGVHLVVDVRNVASSFLSDEDFLGRAVDGFVIDAGLTLVSRHCRGVPAGGFSCVGVLSDSHLSLHTWPVAGVISFDLVTFGEEPALPILPLVEKHFGILRRAGEGRGKMYPDEDPTKVVTKWAHQLRGFRTKEEQKGVFDQENELAFWVLTPFDQEIKKEIFSITTPHQRIDLWENLWQESTPSYYDMLRGPHPLGDKRYLNDKFVSSERMVFLDGMAQGSTDTDRVLYETMVQPVMFAHSNPRRVAIVGGGNGQIIGQLLKHKTVETIVMIEKDEMLVEVVRKYLNSSCDCRNVEGATPVCFDDPRVETLHVDAVDFFTSNFDEKGTIGNVEKFDVVFVGVLNPKNSDDPLYGKEFLDAVVGSLTEHGLISAQVGAAPMLHDPPDHRSMNMARDGLFRHLETRLKTMLVYEESRAGWAEARSFLIGCVSKACKNHWYAKSDVVDAEINKRIVNFVVVADADDIDGDMSFVHFDGGTQRGYGFIPKAWENVYCRREPEPEECKYRQLDLDKEVVNWEAGFEVRRDTDPEPEECKYRQLDLDKEVVNWEAGFEVRRDTDSQASVYSTRNIGKGSYVMTEEFTSILLVTADVHKKLANDTPSSAIAKDFLEYADKYGRESLTEGPGSRVVGLGPSILTRKVGERESANVARISTFLPYQPTYSPVFERNRRMFDVLVVVIRDIVKGEEIILYEG